MAYITEFNKLMTAIISDTASYEYTFENFTMSTHLTLVLAIVCLDYIDLSSNNRSACNNEQNC
ncbi:hypothetical protein CCACVL1_12484 [Corchorus capsularis]|uniref:Uncharacterized protein n=1 Tax=Corchorus capsularis TaxID=210143 RepID=A0A1R3IFD6_COCAP|nr:hypothetical protein CCACVL1_12484 [Corchorus capsularis]